MATQKFTQPAPSPSEPACVPSVQIEQTFKFDIFRGTASALIAAGVIRQEDLAPQQGRSKGLFGFMPDGSPVPAGMTIQSSLPGVFWIKIHANGRGEVRRTVSLEERSQREQDAPTLVWKCGDLRTCHRGSRERLLRDGIPESWIAGLLKPGKKRGRRTLYVDSCEVQVSQSENGISVDRTHVDYYRRFGPEIYMDRRAEFGLPLIVRGHLSLVWSAPKAQTPVCS